MTKPTLAITGAVVFVSLILMGLLAPPRPFPINRPIDIETGANLKTIATDLAAARTIRYPGLFRWLTILTVSDTRLVAGEYVFERPLSALEIFYRLRLGIYSLTQVRVTLLEGATAIEMALALDKTLTNFDRAKFTSLAEPEEGYLFPDTYFFAPAATPRRVIEQLTNNFQIQIKPLLPEIAESKRSLKEIVIMASIVEKEALTDEARAMIAGILWKRLDADMALQVDAVFPYIKDIGRNTFQLTKDDLQFDSPYNTYKYKGLPPGPISNPGGSALRAAIRPAASAYWFYLSDQAGQMHYAKNFTEHKQNKIKYLP